MSLTWLRKKQYLIYLIRGSQRNLTLILSSRLKNKYVRMFVVHDDNDLLINITTWFNSYFQRLTQILVFIVTRISSPASACASDCVIALTLNKTHTGSHFNQMIVFYERGVTQGPLFGPLLLYQRLWRGLLWNGFILTKYSQIYRTWVQTPTYH